VTRPSGTYCWSAPESAASGGEGEVARSKTMCQMLSKTQRHVRLFLCLSRAFIVVYMWTKRDAS